MVQELSHSGGYLSRHGSPCYILSLHIVQRIYLQIERDVVFLYLLQEKKLLLLKYLVFVEGCGKMSEETRKK